LYSLPLPTVCQGCHPHAALVSHCTCGTCVRAGLSKLPSRVVSYRTSCCPPRIRRLFLFYRACASLPSPVLSPRQRTTSGAAALRTAARAVSNTRAARVLPSTPAFCRRSTAHGMRARSHGCACRRAPRTIIANMFYRGRHPRTPRCFARTTVSRCLLAATTCASARMGGTRQLPILPGSRTQLDTASTLPPAFKTSCRIGTAALRAAPPSDTCLLSWHFTTWSSLPPLCSE